MKVETRRLIERLIASRTIHAMLDAGLAIDVSDGEECVLLRSTDHDEILSKMFSTDEDWLYGVKDGKRFGWVQFIYGNSGHDVICDHTMNLETILAPVTEMANWIEESTDAVVGMV